MSINLDAIIEKDTPTPTAKKLRDILFKIWNNKEFVSCILNGLDTEEKRQRMIDFIDEYEVTNSDDVILASTYIEDGLEVEFEEEE